MSAMNDPMSGESPADYVCGFWNCKESAVDFEWMTPSCEKHLGTIEAWKETEDDKGFDASAPISPSAEDIHRMRDDEQWLKAKEG